MEFSAFGPGYGECLLVHLGHGDWMIVDSCVGPDGEPPVLRYLDSLGVDAANDVKLVVASHWHDDHIRGMSKILAACRSAQFACSAALSARELIEAIGKLRPWGRFQSRITSGVEELRRSFELLQPDDIRPTAVWCLEGELLYDRDDRARVIALTPSPRVLIQAFARITALVSQGEVGRVPLPDGDPAAVVLWVEVGDSAMLLGSDLQETRGQVGGWTTVIESESRPRGRRAEIFKVPHHGSMAGHQQRVWEEMLVPAPQAVVCPWSLGRWSLPTEADLARLCTLANQVHTTKRTGSDELSMVHGRLRRRAGIASGRVTLRRRPGGSEGWTATYEHPAGAACLGE